MKFQLLRTNRAQKDYDALEADKGLKKRLQAVRKTLGLIEANPRHSGLNTHEYGSMTGANGEKVFESYAENNTPAAYRIFWHYGPHKGQITVIAITPHP